jgi:hypothetical protein
MANTKKEQDWTPLPGGNGRPEAPTSGMWGQGAKGKGGAR